MNIKDSLKFGVMIGLLEVHKVPFILMMLMLLMKICVMRKVILTMVVGIMLFHCT